MKKMSEIELAKNVIDWLVADDWEVYQEVCSGICGARADIVALKNDLTWIIEVKAIYGLAVLEQAIHWLGYANFISVAVKSTVKRRGGHIPHWLHIDKGIGLIQIDSGGWVSTSERPKLCRLKGRLSIKDCLHPEQKEIGNAGTANGGYYTPFKKTVGDIQRFLATHPGLTLKELIEQAGYFHYANPQSAKGSIAEYIRSGIIPDIKVIVEDGKHKLYYEKQGKND